MDQHIERVAGIDLGDTHCSVCVIDASSGEVLERSQVRTRVKALTSFFAARERLRVALEVGTHSPWVSRLLEEAGHDVVVANARSVRLIYGGKRKSDRLDAEKLARLARVDVKLLAPVQHRSERAQADLALVRSRDALVRSRTQLISSVRGAVKSFGARLPKCDADVFHRRVPEHVPAELLPAQQPLLLVIESLTKQIRAFERSIASLCQTSYPETALFRQVYGVAEITALSYLLTLEDPARFVKSRQVGAFLGLAAGRRQSGEHDPRCRISKEGDEDLRRLMVQCAHIILGPKGRDSDLRRHGLKIMRPGDKVAKRKAVVAVARKLAVLLHSLWSSGEVYEPLRNSRTRNQSPPAQRPSTEASRVITA